MNQFDIWQFGDDMDRAIIFSNGLRDSNVPAHRESYNTIMNFDRMENFLKENRDKYSLNDWQELKEYFEGIAYLSPMNGLVYRMIQMYIIDNLLHLDK